ncbi:MAG TPA: 30S ribosome-binding factor RbfA [Armatimonadota bacterium]|nr:30S ribosome-binding factor RbfA [Armatimonadota bacterium]HOJ23026.1 30S ribosome-binding factor RbfA [Armatimonadota bacterium]HOM82436.1 30S ribosome-binding factor RbfA [Armatimonadota bacterium]HPO72494.1 30S ribosome-binding factor RbfA [Armatimonadota bacterium]HPT97186.1 30S ribosome-binding factor RbfA [Armatimonadota bacterium]
MATTRQRRVAELIKEEVSQILQHEVSDPRIGFATVTDVEVTADLREARVFISVLGDPEQAQESIAALQRAAGYIRRLLGRRVDLRVIPELTFALDRSLERGSRVLQLLHELEQEQSGKAKAE